MHGQDAGNVVSLSAWRAAHAPMASAQVPRAAAAAGQFDAVLRPRTARLLDALQDLDSAVQDLNQCVSTLENRVVHLRDSLGRALTRLDAQRRQNAQVIACLNSGDLDAMEDCRRQIYRQRRAAGRGGRTG